MPLPHDIKTWLDDVWDDASGKSVGSKKGSSRATYNGLELKALINLDAAGKTEELLVVRVRKGA